MDNSDDLDPAALANLRRLGGDRFLGQMIDLFLEHAPKRLAAAQDEERAGNLKGVEAAVHSLKSSAANVGARHLQELAARIEELAGQGQRDALGPLVVQLAAVFAGIQAQLAAVRKGLKP
jgi:HPt (histidine-containing phosphotransfer) domain-containing protein